MPARLRIAEDCSGDARMVELFLSSPGEETFNDVCRWLSPRLMRFFRARGCDEAAAEELTQDVLFTVYRQAATIRDHRLFRGWVYAVARNCLLQRVRKLSRGMDLVALDAMGPDLRAATAPVAPGESDFAGIVSGLAADDREILTLRFVEELEYREIAEVLQIPVGTAKWRVFNSKLKLALQLGKKSL